MYICLNNARSVISVSAEYNSKLKRNIKEHLDKKLNLWDNERKGIMIRYENLKVLKRIIELIDEQNYLNIPISYSAEYFLPDKNDLVSKLMLINSQSFLQNCFCLFIF